MKQKNSNIKPACARLLTLFCYLLIFSVTAHANELAFTDKIVESKTFLINSIKKNRANINAVIEKSKALKSIKNRTESEEVLINTVYTGFIFQACHLETILTESLNYISKIDKDAIESNITFLNAMTIFIGGIAYDVCDGIIGTSSNAGEIGIKEVSDMVGIAREYKIKFKQINDIYIEIFKDKK